MIILIVIILVLIIILIIVMPDACFHQVVPCEKFFFSRLEGFAWQLAALN